MFDFIKKQFGDFYSNVVISLMNHIIFNNYKMFKNIAIGALEQFFSLNKQSNF